MNLKILLWNLQDFFIFMDKYKNEDLKNLSEPKWQLLTTSFKANKEIEKIYDIVKIIQSHDFDIGLFTEVGGEESIKNFCSYFLKDEYLYFHQASNSDRGIDVAVIYKKKFIENSSFKMYTNKEFARGVLHYKFTFKEQKLSFLLTHLKSKLSSQKDFEGREQRQKEVLKLIEIYKRINKDNHHPTFVCGDLNGIITKDETEHELSFFAKKSGLINAFDLLKWDDFEKTTYIYYNKQNDAHMMQLDYFLCDPKWKNIIGPNTKVLDFDGKKRISLPSKKEQKFKYPSDHYPILFEINLG